MAKETILIVDDEEDVLELVRYNLAKEGYAVIAAETGERALTQAHAKGPDLVILDLMLPGIDGLEVCKQLKAEPKTRHIPIIMLTAKGEESDIVTGLELGADDYVTKPFSPKVLIARVRRTLRRRVDRSTEKAPLKIGLLEIDPARRRVLVGSESVDLTFTEFNILRVRFSQYGIAATATGHNLECALI